MLLFVHGSNEALRISSGLGGSALCCFHFNSAGRQARCSFVGKIMEITKRCSKCGLVKSLEEFHRKHTGPLGRVSQCKLCRLQQPLTNIKELARRRFCDRAYYQRNAKGISMNNKQTYPARRLANVAKSLVRQAILHGKLKIMPCEVCGKIEHVHAHHEDYSKPLEVRWLCRSHHRQLHTNRFVLLPALDAYWQETKRPQA